MKYGKILLRNGMISLNYKGKCLVSGNVRKVGCPCDIDEIEDMEIEAIRRYREYAKEKGLDGAIRVYTLGDIAS